jgi:hypothetical protein
MSQYSWDPRSTPKLALGFITSSFGWATPLYTSLIAWSSYPHLHGSSSMLGINVIIDDHLSYQAPLACERTPSIKLGIMKVMSNCKLNICNYDRVLSHWFPTWKSFYACACMTTGKWRRRGRGKVPIRMKMWSSPGPKSCYNTNHWTYNGWTIY